MGKDSHDRFYQLQLLTRPALWGDVGSLLRIQGLIIGGAGSTQLMLLPDANLEPMTTTVRPTVEEWSDFIRRADDPEICVLEGNEKVFHRKARYEISGAVQQKVWAADSFRCVYCARKMGDVQLTIDHYLPLELGGRNDTSNYVSACRRCNKDKGNIHPFDFHVMIAGKDAGTKRHEAVLAILKERTIR